VYQCILKEVLAIKDAIATIKPILGVNEIDEDGLKIKKKYNIIKKDKTS
jgi:hypothetical protein